MSGGWKNHAGQYDLNWFISRTPPLDKGQRQEILRNDLSYLNALYSGRLHLDFSTIRRHQFPILTYAVQHGKKHFLDLVSEHSELFLSLGRYALLFEYKFCEHCNLNSLTAKNLQACDTVEHGQAATSTCWKMAGSTPLRRCGCCGGRMKSMSGFTPC